MRITANKNKFYHYCGQEHDTENVQACKNCGEENPVLTNRILSKEELLELKYTKHLDWINKTPINGHVTFDGTEKSLVILTHNTMHDSLIEWAKYIEKYGSEVYVEVTRRTSDTTYIRRREYLRHGRNRFEKALRLYNENLEKYQILGTPAFIDRSHKAIWKETA